MLPILLVDTDVIIDYLRGRTQAIDYLEGLTNPLLISTITVAELYSGVREGKERVALDAFIATFRLAAVDAGITIQGGLHRRDYGQSHGVGLPDALIAPTAEVHGATLVTLNQKHFPMLASVVVPYIKT